ncbi:LPS export ABC transporter permease LptF [Microvirga sp. W0021]|uniref:LPS export ABC transporter permease LptF n=1 Tax=Hohaiivirga grylli TaxID=3133970 RepID=A0ABV0BIN8_9HYPH
MHLLERYILKIATNAFLLCLIALTGVLWMTLALRQLDFITNKGQTILIFLYATSLSLPGLVTLIAPVALFIATLYTLNKLNSDSELIIMTAAGFPPRRLLKPFLILGTAVCILVAFMTLYLMPVTSQILRNLVTQVRADFVSNVVKEGQFTTLDTGIMFHFREKAGDSLLGIFMQDRRDPTKTIVYIAEKGKTVDVDGDSFLVLDNGSIQRQQPNSRDSSIVVFDSYAINLSSLAKDSGEVLYKPAERPTTSLLKPNKSEPIYMMYSGRFRAALHDRLSAWIYPLAMMMIALAALGDAQTTRQGRGLAIAVAIVAMGTLRIIGFAALSALVRSSWPIIPLYGAPILTIILSLFFFLQGSLTQFWKARISRWIDQHVSLPTLRFPKAP